MKLGEIYDELIDEDYPNTWDIEHFKKLRSFNQRIQYCEKNLQRISSGSSRIVYKIDDTKVLKLAKSKKGLGQNEIEAGYSKYQDIKDILAIVFSYDENNLWIEMELARKATPSIFKQIVGFSFRDFSAALNNHYLNIDNRHHGHRMNLDSDIEKQMWEDEFCYDMITFVASYDLPVGDLTRINSYGVVNRNSSDRIVMIDYGLTNDVYDTYYK